MYTFGLEYDGEVCEEIDVHASSHSEALAKARKLAEQDYMPGTTNRRPAHDLVTTSRPNREPTH